MDHAIATLANSVSIEKNAWDYLLQYGVVGLMCIVFGLVIRYLYNEAREERKAFAERDKKHAEDMVKCAEGCKVEKESLRADYEKRHREVIDGYMHQLSVMRATQDKREEDIRRETASLVTKLSESAQEKDEALLAMLNKFYERLIK
jgi:hypothetical protein